MLYLMKKLFFYIFLNTILINCNAQSDSCYFGEYYKLGVFNFQVPFAGQPHLTPIQFNDKMSYFGFNYACLKPTDDLNRLYGIDVYEIKFDTLFNSKISKIDYIAEICKITYVIQAKGKIVKQDSGDFHGDYCIRQKIKIYIPELGDMFVNSLYISINNLVLRIYTFTPIANDDNYRINCFFESIKY
jgi:hypothetical protein